MNKPRVAIVFSSYLNIYDIKMLHTLANCCQISLVSSKKYLDYIKSIDDFGLLSVVKLSTYESQSSYLPSLERVLKGFKTVVIKGRLGLFAYQVIKVKWKIKFSLICWVDNYNLFPFESLKEARFIRSKVNDMSDAFMVSSEQLKKNLIFEGIEENRIFKVFPYTDDDRIIDCSKPSLIKDDFPIVEQNIYISVVANIKWNSGISDLLIAVAALKQQDSSLNRKLCVLVYGQDPYVDEIRNLSLKLKIDDDVIYISPEKYTLKDVLKITDAIYYSSYIERDLYFQNPGILLSATKNMIPVIAHRNGMVEEFVEKHRIDFSQGSIHSLTKAIHKFIYKKNIVNDLCLKNKDKSEKLYSRDKTEEQFLKIINKVSFDHAALDANDSPESLLLEAQNMAANKDYLSAVTYIEKVFEKGDLEEIHLSELYRLMGDCLTKLGDLDKAEESFLKSLDFDNYSCRSFVGLGTLCLLKHKYEISIVHFQKAISLDPKDETPFLGLGLSFHGIGKYTEAHKWIKSSLDLNPENVSAIYSLLKASHKLNRYDEIISVIERYLAIHKQDHNLIFTLASLFFVQKRYKDSKKLIGILLEFKPEDRRSLDLLNKINSISEGSQFVSS